MNEESAQGTTPSALVWGVKTSFRRYLRTAGGTVTTSPPAREDGFFFVFPLDSESADTGDVSFGGSVHFAAHFGALDFSLSSPAITRYRGASWLTVAAPVGTGDVSRLTIALLTGGSDAQTASVEHARDQVELWPVLTAEGSHLFGDVYPTETLLDPLYVPRALIDARSS